MISQHNNAPQHGPDDGSSFSAAQLGSTVTEMALYTGPALEGLPEQLLERLVPLLKKALSMAGDSVPKWQVRCIESEQATLSNGARYETIEYQSDHDDPPGARIVPEAYEYEGDGRKYRIAVVNRTNGSEEPGAAWAIFSVIGDELHDQFKRAPSEAIGSMMTYDIIAATRSL